MISEYRDCIFWKVLLTMINDHTKWRVLCVAYLLVITSTCFGETLLPVDTEAEFIENVEPTADPLEPIITLSAPGQIFVEPVSAPQWTVSVGAIFLRREKGDGSALVRQGFVNPNGAPLLSASEFRFSHQTGYNIDITHHGKDFDLHFNHFAVDGWNSTGVVTGPVEQFASVAPGFLTTPGDLVRMTYTSDIASIEFNLKPHTDSIITPFVGFRWIELNERLFQEHSFLGVETPGFSIDTRNDLYGLQIGADVQLINTSHIELIGIGKFAIAGNAARNNMRSFIGGTTLPQIESGGIGTAFIYDLALKGKVHLSDHVSVTGGYSVIILSQIALAPSQLQQNQINTVVNTASTAPLGSRHIDRGDFLIVHGGQVSLEVTW